MKIVLRCPKHCSTVPALSRRHPLVLAPFLGQTVLEHTLAALATEGFRQVRIEASDRVNHLQEIVGSGQAWGLKVEFPSPHDLNDDVVEDPVITLDHLPQLPQQPLWNSYRDWYNAQQTLLSTMARQRVGMREIAPDVFVGLRSQVTADARLIGPCWIGANVFVGSGTLIGPGTILEDGCYIDAGAEIIGSVAGPKTYVGSCTEIRDSFAWGSDLLQLDTGSVIEVSDPFLLSAVKPKPKIPAFLQGILLRGAARNDSAIHTARRSEFPGREIRSEPLLEN